MSGLYPTLLRILREAATPITHQELFHHPDIQAYGVSHDPAGLLDGPAAKHNNLRRDTTMKLTRLLLDGDRAASCRALRRDGDQWAFGTIHRASNGTETFVPAAPATCYETALAWLNQIPQLPELSSDAGNKAVTKFWGEAC